MYKVMIVGHGYVGSAVASLFSDEEKVIIDPKFNDNKILITQKQNLIVYLFQLTLQKQRDLNF